LECLGLTTSLTSLAFIIIKDNKHKYLAFIETIVHMTL